MLIKENKLRQIINSVIRESMGMGGMPPAGGSDPKIQAMNMLKQKLSQMSGGQINMFVEPTIDTSIEDDEPYVYGSFEAAGGANVYSVYMSDSEFRISLDVAVDEMDQMVIPINPSEVVADGAATLAADVMHEYESNFSGGSTTTRGGMGNPGYANNDWEYEEVDSYDSYGDDAEDEFDEELLRAEEAERLRQLANPPPKPRYQKSQGYDPYDAERDYHKQELANWNAQYGKKKK